MTVWRVRSRAARAARTATVLPAPTSPVITPMRRSAMHQPMRATASSWAVWRCSMAGAEVAAERHPRETEVRGCKLDHRGLGLLTGEQVELAGDLAASAAR